MPQAHQKFAQAMDAARLTTIELGRRLGCDPSTLSHIRSGRRRPSLQLALAIADASRSWPGGTFTVAEWQSTRIGSSHPTPAADVELNVMAELARLEPGARGRVLAWAAQRWPDTSVQRGGASGDAAALELANGHKLPLAELEKFVEGWATMTAQVGRGISAREALTLSSAPGPALNGFRAALAVLTGHRGSTSSGIGYLLRSLHNRPLATSRGTVRFRRTLDRNGVSLWEAERGVLGA